MKHPIQIINRVSGQIEEEQVWGEDVLHFLYGKGFCSRTAGVVLRKILSIPLFSHLWGAYHDLSWSKRAVEPFCRKYGLETSEFEKELSSFTSFNDFFVRSLKPSARPIDSLPNAILPADARYTLIPDLSNSDFLVKGQRFNLSSFLQSERLARMFQGGIGILARLCPTDCHRFYFPISGTASVSKRIAGSYLSVSPIATSSLPSIFWTNVRQCTFIESDQFGTVAMVEIGATNCASIVQTYTPGFITKGQEKGYFRLGGSAIMLIFEGGNLQIAPDLIIQSQSGLEIRGLIGQLLGTSSLGSQTNCLKFRGPKARALTK